MRAIPTWYLLSLLAAGVMAIASLAGLFSELAYSRETVSWAAQGFGQDLINVAIVAPLVFASARVARRGSARARLVLVGALLYMVYSYVLYAFFVHFGPLFPVYVAALGLSVFAVISSATGLDTREVQGSVAAHPWRRSAAVFLAGIGLLFALLWLSEIVPALMESRLPASVAESRFPVNPVHVLDLALFLPATIATGLLLWWRRPAGLFFAIPILTFLSLMGTALIAMVLVMRDRGLPAPLSMLAVTVLIVAGADLLTIRLLSEPATGGSPTPRTSGVHMRINLAALFATLALPAALSGQNDVMIEVRPTFAVPVGKLAGASLAMGPAFGIVGSMRVRENVHLYGSWDWARFGATSSFAGTDLEFEETGYSLGFRVERPCPAGHPVALRLEAGGTYKHVEIENSAGDLIADSEHRLGYEVGAGAAFGLSAEWKLVPMVRFRALNPRFTIASTMTSGNLRYASLELTLARGFR